MPNRTKHSEMATAALAIAMLGGLAGYDFGLPSYQRWQPAPYRPALQPDPHLEKAPFKRSRLSKAQRKREAAKMRKQVFGNAD